MAGGLLHKPHSLAGENQKPVRNSLKSSNLGYEPPSAHDWASSLPNHLNGYPDSFQPILMDLVGENADSIGVTLLSVGDAVVTATAYGSDLTTVLDSVSVSNPGTGVGWYNKDRITLTGPGIARVRFEITTPYPGDGFGIDDLSVYKSYPVAVAVSDGRGGEATQTFDLLVVPSAPNAPPAITSTPRTAIQVGRAYRYQVVAVDPNNDPLAFSLDAAPAGMTIDSGGMVQWQPTAAQLGPSNVIVRVDDGRSGLATQNFSISVTAQVVNHAPQIVSAPPVAASVGTFYRYDLRGTDPDGDSLVWSLDQRPAKMSIDPLTGTIVWMPTFDQLGTKYVAVRVFDCMGGQATQNYGITVRSGDVPPAITSAPPTQATVGQRYIYAIAANDVDGDPLSFSLVAGPIGMTIDPASGLVQWTPGAAQVGPQDVQVRVDDGRGGFATQSYQVVVMATAANQAPLITSTPLFFATIGNLYAYPVTATDSDGDPVSFAILAGPSGMTIDSVGGQAQWTPDVTQAGRWTVTVAALDGRGGVGTQTFTLTAGDNHAPTITSAAVAMATAAGW